ncbi:hypothetical protein KFK09_028264 [Dendrobium nobile]|uniref:CCHC-type domain-containing protein n=1 Tax=Dendrobium nobile TaxID=94219 RepID=A0A8T3A6Y7_DENNO|nr:hypothetical protein KFK09_028264 [Dendrobium nobile]
MAGGDRRSPPRSSGGGGDGSIGSDERRRSGVGSGGSKKNGDRSGAGSGGFPSKSTTEKSKGKACEAGKMGSEGSSEGRWEVKPKSLDLKTAMPISKGGFQTHANSMKREDPPSSLKMEIMPAAEVSMRINPTFVGMESSMEVEELQSGQEESIDLEEMFDVDAAMLGRTNVMKISDEQPLANADPMIGADCAMEVSSNLNDQNNVVMDDVGGNELVKESTEVEMAGMNETEVGSAGLSNQQNSPLGDCGNAASIRSSEIAKGKAQMQVENRFPLFSSGASNAWRKPEHVPIQNPEERNALFNDWITIDLNMEYVMANVAKLERAVVGKILGRRVSFFLLKNKIQRQWGRFGEFQLTTLGHDCFICVFGSTEARNAILCGGPWFIEGNIVGLDRWTPQFSPESMEGLSSPVWIRLPNLPLQYWDDCNIARIASKIGVPLWIDAQTGNWGRREYARVCVRMCLDWKLQSGIWINGMNGRFYQKVEYEGIGILCYGCGKVGHWKEFCPSRAVGQGGNEARRTEEHLKQGGKGDGSSTQNLGKNGKLDPIQTKKMVLPVVKTEDSVKGKAVDSREKGGNAEAHDECNGSKVGMEEGSQDNEDHTGPWIQVPPRRRRTTRAQGKNKENVGSKQSFNIPRKVDLNKVQVPDSQLKPTHKQSRMGFKQRLPFTAGIRMANRANALKELNQLGPMVEAPRKRKKKMGARKKQTGYYLRSLIGNNEVMFVGLVETMIEDISRSDVDRLIGPNWEFFHYAAEGRSGGLLVMWRQDTTHFEVVSTMNQAIIGHLVMPNLQKWGIVLVYASKSYHSRRMLWSTIEASFDAELPMIVGGDFNCFLDQSEKKGGRKYSYSVGAQEMATFLVENDLHDLGFMGPKFTWTNNKTGNNKIWVRLDRVLMNSEGLLIASDHCPLLLNLTSNPPKSGSRWYRFEDIWMSYPATWKLVWKEWNKTDYGQPADVLNRKCSRTLRALFFWSRNLLKELGNLKNSLEARLGELQELECSNAGLNEAQEQEMRRKASELNTTLASITTWWRQRAKAKWIEEGDANSHFFHSFASARKRGNRILVVQKPNGDRSGDPALIQEEFMKFFMLKWEERQIVCDSWPSFHSEDKILDRVNEILEAEITEQEVRQVVFSMGNNLAPGIDGITSSFLKFYWEIIKCEVTRAIIHFFSTNSMCESWKDTVVVLIPKVENAIVPAKFRPISLCQSFYKVVAKILINRLKPVLGSIVSEEQGAFVPGRSISNHGLIAQEMMNKFQFSVKKSGMMALKIDMEQAYDYDILIFAEASRRNANCVMKLLGHYYDWTGQKINGGKSAVLFSRSCPNWKKRMIAKLLGYRKYSYVLDDSHFSSKGVLHSIEKLGRTFLWQKDSNCRGMHYVEWKELCQPRDHGGLGFHGLDNWQGALRARLAWQVVSNPNLLLHKVLRGKYGMELWNDTQVYKASTTWKVIHDGAKALRTIIRWNIGDGQSIDVMQDCWILDRRIDKWPTFVNVNELENVRWLFYRGLSANSLCPWGCQVEENLDHCTALCNKLKEVFNILRKWGFAMPSVFSLTELMQEIHDNVEINPSLGRIYCYTIYQGCRLINNGAPPPPPPPPGWLKFNFDDAVKPSNLAGIGIVVRNFEGALIAAAGKVFEHWDAFQAEVSAAAAIREVHMDWMFDLEGGMGIRSITIGLAGQTGLTGTYFLIINSFINGDILDDIYHFVLISLKDLVIFSSSRHPSRAMVTSHDYSNHVRLLISAIPYMDVTIVCAVNIEMEVANGMDIHGMHGPNYRCGISPITAKLDHKASSSCTQAVYGNISSQMNEQNIDFTMESSVAVKVEKLIAEGRWNVEELNNLFGDELVCIICKIPILVNMEEDVMELIQFMPSFFIIAIYYKATVKDAYLDYRMNLDAREDVMLERSGSYFDQMCKTVGDFVMSRGILFKQIDWLEDSMDSLCDLDDDLKDELAAPYALMLIVKFTLGRPNHEIPPLFHIEAVKFISPSLGLS